MIKLKDLLSDNIGYKLIFEDPNKALDVDITYTNTKGQQKKIKARNALRLPKDHPAHIQAAKIAGPDDAPVNEPKPKEQPGKAAQKAAEPAQPGQPTKQGQTAQGKIDKKTPAAATNQPANEPPPPGKLSGADFKSSAEKTLDKNTGKSDIPMLKDLMPNANFDRKPLSAVTPIERQQISTIIDKLAELGNQAKEKGEKAPNFNLCQVSVPGTNLYCDGNIGIPRDEMPQFKGTPEPGSQADKLPKDKNGEADTEEFFKQMLEKQGIKVSEPHAVPPDRLKATQSELVGVKVAGMEKALEENQQHPAITAPIYVSNDGYVLDGHHRWAAIVAYNAANPKKQIPMKIRVIDEPIRPLVKRSNAFAEAIGIKAKAADTSVK